MFYHPFVSRTTMKVRYTCSIFLCIFHISFVYSVTRNDSRRVQFALSLNTNTIQILREHLGVIQTFVLPQTWGNHHSYALTALLFAFSTIDSKTVYTTITIFEVSRETIYILFSWGLNLIKMSSLLPWCISSTYFSIFRLSVCDINFLQSWKLSEFKM
jgi:hypothetical protein